MTTDQVELICLNMYAASQPGTGWTYKRVVSAAVSFGSPRAEAPAVVGYIAKRGCPQYAHLLPNKVAS
jgi:hypothetical protein